MEYATNLWSREIITDAVKENVLDPSKGGKEERASSLFTALYNAVKVAEPTKQTVHMIRLVGILEDVGGTQIGAVLRGDLADFDIHIPPKIQHSVFASDHKEYHSETTYVNESQMDMVEERDDRELCKKVVRLLCRVLESHHHRLLKALEDDSLLADFASKMLEKGLISKPIKSGSFDEIMADFQARWELVNLKKLEKQCLDFLDILRDLGGSCKMAADVLESDWIKNVEEEIKETFLRRKRFQKSHSTPQNDSKKPVIYPIRNAYSETDLLQLSIDNQQFDNESQHVHDANDSIHGRKSLESVPEETVPTDSKYTDYCQHGEEEQDLVSNGSPHFTTSSARPMNLNDPHNPIVPGKDQKQSSTLSFPTHHEDSGVALSMHTSQTTSASNLSTLQSPPESQTPYQEESLDQTQNLSGIRKRFVAPTQATHIRQSQSGPSDTAYLQSQPFSSTHSLDLFIQSLKEDKKKLEVEKTEAITILRKKYEQDIIELKQRVKELEQKRESERKKIEFERKNLEKHKEETKNQERKLKEQQEKQDLREESLKDKDVDLQSQNLQLTVDQNEFHAQKNELSKQKKNVEDREEKLKGIEQREKEVSSREQQLQADKRNFQKHKREGNKKTKEQNNLYEENRNLVQQKTQMEEENKILKEEKSKQRSELQNRISTQQSKLNEQDEKLQKQERNGKIILIMFIIASLLLLICLL